MSHIGGRLCYFTLRNGVEVLQRQSGDFTKHSCDVLHAVTCLISGTRYSLFVVDRANGLGETGIIEADVELVKSILAIVEHEEAITSFTASPIVIPYSAITTGELIGSGNSKSSIQANGLVEAANIEIQCASPPPHRNALTLTSHQSSTFCAP